MSDRSELEVGQAICRLHEYLLTLHNPEFSEKLHEAERQIGSWLIHPLERNWDIVSGINNFINGGEWI